MPSAGRPQHVEQRRRSENHSDRLRLRFSRQRDRRPRSERGERFERRGSLFPGVVIGRRDDRGRPSWRRAKERHEPVALGIGKRPQNDVVDDRIRGDAGGNREREDHDRQRACRLEPPDRAPGITDGQPQCRHDASLRSAGCQPSGAGRVTESLPAHPVVGSSAARGVFLEVPEQRRGFVALQEQPEQPLVERHGRLSTASSPFDIASNVSSDC